jgi:hypothetical protein
MQFSAPRRVERIIVNVSLGRFSLRRRAVDFYIAAHARLTKQFASARSLGNNDPSSARERELARKENDVAPGGANR